MDTEKDPAAVALAAKRHRYQKQCVVCGKEIEGLAQRRYCSNACSLKASRAKRKLARESA